MARIAQLVYETGFSIANTDRVLERGQQGAADRVRVEGGGDQEVKERRYTSVFRNVIAGATRMPSGIW